MRPSRRLLRRRAAAPYDRLMRNRATGGCRPSSMTIRHSLPAREAKSRRSSSATATRCTDIGPADARGASLPGQGTAEIFETSPANVSCFSVRRGHVYHRRHPGLDLRRDVTLDPDERLHGPVVLEQVFARLDQHAVHGKATGHVAKESHAARMTIDAAMTARSSRSRGVEIVSSRSSCSRSSLAWATVL